jgi:DNA (cytosine-5)-methyltransferase 3A
MKPINVLSLFDGMSCGQIALQRAGIKVNKYYASEIDKHAINVAMANYPDTIQLGNVSKYKYWDIDFSKIDIIIGGSPCQGFSFAGKGFNFNDPRSKLFFTYVEILNHILRSNPKVLFLLENVRMKSEHENVISRYLGVNPLVINSALVSAQNRVRLYWTNINSKPVGLFGYMEPDIPQPKDKKIFIKDILQTDVDKKYYLSETALKRVLSNNPKINASFGNTRSAILITDIFGKEIKNQNKARCFTAGGNSGGNHSDMDLIMIAAMRGRNIAPADFRNDEGLRIRNGDKAATLVSGSSNSGTQMCSLVVKTEQQLELRNDNKTNTITSVQKDNLVFNYRQDTPNDINGKKNCLWANAGGALKGVGITNGATTRRLTPVECERLQTVPDNYTNHVSDSQRYKMLGNGWTIDVISHIFSFMKLD